MSHHFRRLRLLAGVAVAATCGYLAFGRLQWRDITDVLTALHVAPLAIALLLLAAGYATRIVRWWLMLRVFGPELKARQCAWPFLVSQALNNVLPLRAGDVVRVVAFRRELGVPAGRLAGTLVFERLLDLLTLLLLLFIGTIGVNAGIAAETGSVLRAATLVAAIGVAAVFVMPNTLRGGVALIVARLPSGARARIDTSMAEFIDTLTRLKARHLLQRLAFLSVLVWLFEAGVFLAASMAFATPLPPTGAVLSTASGTLGTLLPGAPGHVGTFDYFAMLGAMAHGYNRDMAAAYALAVHTIVWLPITVVGLTYFAMPAHRALWRRGRQPRVGQ